MIKGRFIAAVNALEITGTVSKKVINIIKEMDLLFKIDCIIYGCNSLNILR